jgi:hypothetical protein
MAEKEQVGNYGSLKQLGLASAVTMRENTHWVQAGAQNEELPGRQCKRSYISQNIYFGDLSNFINNAW